MTDFETDFEIAEAALRRYQPVGPTGEAARRIAVALRAQPLSRTSPWRRAAAALLILSVPIAWWAFKSAGSPASQATQAGSAVPPMFANYWTSQPRVEVPGVQTRADVVVVGFNDWQCPACLELYAALKAIFAEYARSHPGAVAILLRDFPWDMRCNTQIAKTLHEGACDAAVAVRAARDRGKGDDMIEWLHANRGLLRDAKSGAGALIAAQAETMMPGLDFRSTYETRVREIGRDASAGGVVGVQTTPTYFINGIKLATVKPEEIGWAIRLELGRAKK